MDESNSTTGEQVRFAGLLLAACLPAFAAVLAGTVPQGRPFAAAPLKGLSFDQHHVDLLEVDPQPTIPVYFRFTTQSSGAVKILKLTPSCGCLHPRLFMGEEQFLPKSESVTFESDTEGGIYVSVSTANEEPGPHDYSVEVDYDDGQLRKELVTFHLVIPEQKILVEPNQLVVYQLDGAEATREVRITDARGGELEITKAYWSREIVGADLQIGARVKTSDGYWSIPVEVSVAANVPSDLQRAFLVLETNDAEYPQIRLPVMLQGRPASIQQVSAESLIPLPNPR